MTSVLLSLALLLVSAVSAQEKLPLEKVAHKKGVFRLAAGLTGKLERTGYAVEIDGRKLTFFDLDGNHKLTGTDGLALTGHPFVVPLPEELLLSTGQYAYRFEGTRTLTLRRTDLKFAEEVFPQAMAITEIRIRAGLIPLVIDEVASDYARKHLDYLERNRIVRGPLTMRAHSQHPDRPGYSLEGARAGKAGILGASRSLTDDVMAWFSTTYHAVKLLDPGVRRIGLARRHNLTLLYPLSNTNERAVLEFLVQPPDGARHVPVSFSVGGEVPSPVPGSRLSSGTGFPLFVLLPTGRALSRVTIFELQDSSGASVPGYLSSPAKPANPLFSRNLGCAFFIPKAFLESGETYTATFKMDWMPEPIRWSFRTWEWTPDVK